MKSSCLTVLAILLASGSTQGAQVSVLRTPDGGIQPQAAVDGKGVVHLIYFKGKPGAGDIFYVRQEPGKSDFSNPIQVNTRPGSAIAIGTIRGAHLAIGKRGRVHVAWMGGQGAEPVPVADGKPKTPMVYTRLNEAGSAFEPERNVLTWTGGLDGG